MSDQKIIAGLDIGSSKIRTVIGKTTEKKNIIQIMGVGVSPSMGVRRGSINDIEEAVANITAALEDAERMAGEPIHRVYVSTSGSHIETYDSKGVIAISGQNAEITEDDVDRVLDAARAVSLPANREILRIIPKNFSVDSQHGIKYPVGMTGIRLEVEAHIIAGQTASIKNLEKCLYQTGIDTEEIVPSGLAAAESVLTRQQKELGSVLIEIGASSTNVAIFEEGSVIYSAVIPAGGEHVTNDLAIGLRTAIETAEKIKIEYGSTDISQFTDRDTIDLSAISKNEDHTVSKLEMSKIIEARYNEIFIMVRDELEKIGYAGALPAGAVLCGGAVKIPGCLALAREILQLPAQIGTPLDVDGLNDKINDPSFASIVGLLHFGNRYGSNRGIFDFGLDITKWFDGIGQFFKKFMP